MGCGLGPSYVLCRDAMLSRCHALGSSVFCFGGRGSAPEGSGSARGLLSLQVIDLSACFLDSWSCSASGASVPAVEPVQGAWLPLRRPPNKVSTRAALLL